MFQSTFVKAVSPSVDGKNVRLAARIAVVIQVAAKAVGRAPVQRVARHPTNCHRPLEAGEGKESTSWKSSVHRIARHATNCYKQRAQRKSSTGRGDGGQLS